MVKKLLLLLFFVVFANSFSQKKNDSDYKMVRYLVISDSDSIYVDEMRFSTNSSFSTRKLMFDKFGKWDKEIYRDGETFPVLIWKNKHLLNDSEKVFTIIAGGVESYKEMYSSLLVFDENNTNCLSENYPLRKEIIDAFAAEIKNPKKDNVFYKMFKRYEKPLK